jgi:predicted nicotinamide N-methyase
MSPRDPRVMRDFILASTAIARPPLVPEIALQLATEVTPLWQATERHLAETGIEPPFWAFAWAGGQVLARTILDRPELVRDRSVLDFATGSGLVAIAAARAGAARVAAVDRDPLAIAAAALNAERNEARLDARCADLLGEASLPAWAEAEVVLAGDVCYDRAMSAPVLAFLRARAARGALVLLGDPGRAYLPADGLDEIARRDVPTPDGVESTAVLSAAVYRVRA